VRLVPAVLTKRAVREAGNADGGTATISLIRTLVLCDGDAAKYRIEGLSIPSFAQAILHFAAVRPFRAPAIVRASAPTAVLQLIYWLCFTISATLLLLGSTTMTSPSLTKNS
jgi:hypothetical protein